MYVSFLKFLGLCSAMFCGGGITVSYSHHCVVSFEADDWGGGGAVAVCGLPSGHCFLP